MAHVQLQVRNSLIPVVHLHETHENSKFTGKYSYNCTQSRTPILQQILNKRYTLLPFTIYPGGQIGPLATTFLWSTPHQPSICIKLNQRSLTNLTHPLAKDLQLLST
jgi:hypothetical protein